MPYYNLTVSLQQKYHSSSVGAIRMGQLDVYITEQLTGINVPPAQLCTSSVYFLGHTRMIIRLSKLKKNCGFKNNLEVLC